MKILSLQTRNFRNLADREWKFDARFQVVRGPNEAGKSSLLEAILADQDEKASGVSREQMMKWLSDHKVRDTKQCDRRDEHAQHTPVPTPTPRGV